MHLGCLSFSLLWLAFAKGYCLLNPPSVVLPEENIIISDGENEGKERKWLTQHLTATSAVFKALRMRFLRVVQEADQRFSTSPVSRLGASQLCHLGHRSQGGIPRNQLAQNTSMLLCRHALSLLLRKACCSLWNYLESPAAGCSGCNSSCWATATAPLAACQAAELFDTIRHWCFRNGGKMWHLLLSFMCTLSGLSSFSLILLQLKQFHLGAGLSSHRCLEGKGKYVLVKSLTYFSLGWVWTGGKTNVTT